MKDTALAPAIGVAYVSFLLAQAEFQRTWEISQLHTVEDPTWVPNAAIHELQRRFAKKEDTALLDFVRRSNRIASSLNGRDVIVVRDHHAYDVADGFIELNQPPDPANGYATQVINFFTWGEDSSTWGKATLPRYATVECIRYEDDGWFLCIRHKTTGKSLTFRGSTQKIRSLSGIGVHLPYKDEQLWMALENKEQNWGAELRRRFSRHSELRGVCRKLIELLKGKLRTISTDYTELETMTLA